MASRSLIQIQAKRLQRRRCRPISISKTSKVANSDGLVSRGSRVPSCDYNIKVHSRNANVNFQCDDFAQAWKSSLTE